MDGGFRNIVWAILAFVIWWAAVTSFWQSSDTRLVAIVLALGGVATIGAAAVGLYKKFADGGW